MSAEIPDFEKAEYVGQPRSTDFLQPAFVADIEAERKEHTRFVHAILLGVGAAIVGSILYAAFTIVTHIAIGYVAIGVGYLVGKAMLYATSGFGGRRYQIAAAILTYLSVSMAAVPEILWQLHSRGTDLSHISSRGVIFLAEYGVASPFLELKQGLGGLIGLFILFIGIRAAWGLTADRRIATGL